MNKYFALRKTNRMRTELLTEKSQAVSYTHLTLPTT